MEKNKGPYADYAHEHWALLDADGKPLTEYKYNYVTPWGDGYFKAEIGAKKNILRPDGTEVLKEWFNDVDKVDHGYFAIGITKRKTATTPTTYLRGLAHVSGTILFPPVFTGVRWIGDKHTAFYAESGEKPLCLTIDGSIYDPQGEHLPENIKLDEGDYFEKFINWVLPGLQFFYRDTDAEVDVRSTYEVGDVLRAGFFVDVTTKLYRPAHRTRFLIASAHVARLFEVEDICRHNPKVGEWNLTVLHPNSYFKVMDIYEKDGFTQVFLLHIPMSAAKFFGDNEVMFNMVDSSSEVSLVNMARSSFDDKLSMDVHPRSKDEEFVQRMFAPVGLCNDMRPCPLPPVEFDEENGQDEASALSRMIHKLAEDDDVEMKFEITDNFPWKGVEHMICDGCIYSNGIEGKGEGCGRLFKNAFRNRYVKGACEYRKTDLFTPSEFEAKRTREQKAAQLKAEKTADSYALALVKDFIRDHLAGDLDNLRGFDMTSIMSSEKYGNPFNCNDNKILRAMLVLAFGDAWPGLNVDAAERHEFEISKINNPEHLLGSNIMDQYCMLLKKYDPKPSQNDAALEACHAANTIGNYIIWPSKASFRGVLEGYSARKYMDKFLSMLYTVMTGEGKPDMDLKAALHANRKRMEQYQGEEGFQAFVNNMMLEDYVGRDGLPTEKLSFVWPSMKGLDRDVYLSAAEHNCEFWNTACKARTESIIKKLKNIVFQQ